jgi:hypothetical protein
MGRPESAEPDRAGVPGRVGQNDGEQAEAVVIDMDQCDGCSLCSYGCPRRCDRHAARFVKTERFRCVNVSINRCKLETGERACPLPRAISDWPEGRSSSTGGAKVRRAPTVQFAGSVSVPTRHPVSRHALPLQIIYGDVVSPGCLSSFQVSLHIICGKIEH